MGGVRLCVYVCVGSRMIEPTLHVSAFVDTNVAGTAWPKAVRVVWQKAARRQQLAEGRSLAEGRVR